jgi:hypothetical protein
MKITIRKINKLPRVFFEIKGIMTKGYLCIYEIYFPIRPKYFFQQFLYFFHVYPEYFITDELGFINSYSKIYLENMRILQIGLGSGITLIHNTKNGGNFVTAIEASKVQIEKALKNIRLNDISEKQYKIIHGFSGNPTGVYDGFDIDTKYINFNSLDFDILELDCEGSEVELLASLYKKPRFILVEFHPMLRNMDYFAISSDLSRKGYKLIQAYTVTGNIVEIDRVHDYFNESNLKKLKENSNVGDYLLVLTFAFGLNT